MTEGTWDGHRHRGRCPRTAYVCTESHICHLITVVQNWLMAASPPSVGTDVSLSWILEGRYLLESLWPSSWLPASVVISVSCQVRDRELTLAGVHKLLLVIAMTKGFSEGDLLTPCFMASYIRVEDGKESVMMGKFQAAEEMGGNRLQNPVLSIVS